MKRVMTFTLLIIVLVLSVSPVNARDVTRDLRRMVGYTIVLADTVASVSENGGSKFIKLNGGQVFKVDLMLLDPFFLTDVIVFAKAPSKELIQKYKGQISESLLYSYRLMVDNEMYDATLQ